MKSIKPVVIRGGRHVIYWRSDVDSSEDEQSYSILLSVCRSHVKTWSIDTINVTTLLPHVEELSGVNTCMYYIGNAFPYFAYHLDK